MNIISIDLTINCIYVNMITLLNRGWGGEMITVLHREECCPNYDTLDNNN